MNGFTAEADGWRSAMTRGQEVASVPRFSGEGNEFFTAEGDAWRQAMARGQTQLPAAAVADDHGGMTHKCDGCSDGAPCGSCGGNVSRTSPAYQALGWGMMQADSSGTTDPFWKAATVAQALRDAPGRTDSADWIAIQSMVDRTQALHTVATQGMNASGAMMKAWPGGVLFSPDGSGPPETETDTDGTEGVDGALLVLKSLRIGAEVYTPRGVPVTTAGPKCKVKKFLLPKRWARYPGEGSDSGGKVGWRYCAELEYVNKEPEFACACCVYRHFWLPVVNTVKNLDPAYLLDLTKKGGQYGGARVDGSKKGDPDDPAKEVGKYANDGCRLSWFDHPHAVNLYGPFEITWDYIGVVYDRCRNWTVVASKRMILYSKGSIVTEGDRNVVRYSDNQVSKNVPHQPAATAWNHQNAERSKDGRVTVPGVPVPGLPDAPKTYGNKEEREKVGLTSDCP